MHRLLMMTIKVDTTTIAYVKISQNFPVIASIAKYTLVRYSWQPDVEVGDAVCGNSTEDALHFILFCPALATARY